MTDSEVSEMAGVKGSGDNPRWVALREKGKHICIQVDIYGTNLTVAEARKLANQLRRLALRIERKAS